ASCSPQLIQPHSISTLFPYTTLFRSEILPILGVLKAGHFKNGMNGQRRGGYPCLFQCALKGTEIELFVLSPLPDHFDGRNQILRSEEHTSELQSRENLVCRLLLEKKK